MRRDRYLKQFAEHMPHLRSLVLKAGLNYDDASEVLGICAEKMLKTKKYVVIEPGKLKAFLQAQITFYALDLVRQQEALGLHISRLPDSDEVSDFDSAILVANQIEVAAIEERECPFCFKANLNEYGACAMCHTIVPSHIRTKRNTIRMTEETLAVEFDFNKQIDVQNAVARLTPLEQKVVKACGLGNDSLESFALDLNVSKTSMVRIWIEAKVKLQEYLSEYAPKHLSSRGANAFRMAMQRLENTQEL